jgi:ferritin-like metal-binding protein YciE
MPENGNLHDTFIEELRDAYDGEKQLLNALVKLAKTSTSDELRGAFESHREETEGHVERLEQVFEQLGERPRGKHCDGLAGIIEEGKSIMEEDLDDATMDACLIAAGQRAEHYEMAAYGTLVAWAQAMGHRDAAKLLQKTLDEEKAADAKLTEIAEGGVNASAAAGMNQDNGEENDEEGADDNDRRGRHASSGSRRPPAGSGARNGNPGSRSAKSRTM